MRRAGYDVWLAYDLDGSYEETPPHLLASLQRDRRWCHGNLQHLWFLFAPGLTLPSRMNILIGIMAYVSSPLWLLFLLLSPMLFTDGHPHAGVGLLFGYVMSLLLVPKLFGATQMISTVAQTKTFGGRLKIFRDVLAETICSMMLAPILMLFYTQFVWSSFFAGHVGWGRQKRADDTGPSWQESTDAHWGPTLFAIVAVGLVAWLAPAWLPWLLLVLIGPIVAIPLCRVLASNKLGLKSRRHGWFMIPEEIHPPWELQKILEPVASSPSRFPAIIEQATDFGLLEAVLDPYVNAIHVSLLRERSQVSVRTHDYMIALADRLLRDGPHGLTPTEKKTLLWDADTMLAVHQQLWSRPASEVHGWWQAAFRIYNQSSQREFASKFVPSPSVTRQAVTAD